MNLNIKYGVLALAATFACSSLSGCLRDGYGECPPLSVNFGIKDLTYDNSIDPDKTEFQAPSNSGAKFNEIIPSIYCVLHDANGNMVREMRIKDIGVSDLSNHISFDKDLPFGKYSLIAWGALQDEAKLGDDPSTLDMANLDHDVYLTTAEIDYQYNKAEYQADFMRTTSLIVLLTEWKNSHDAVNKMEMSLTALSAEVDKQFAYSKAHDIKLSKSVGSSNTDVTYMRLPPSATDYSSVMHVRYFNEEDPKSVNLEPEDRTFKVKRNEVIVLKHEIDIMSKTITVSELVDGRWQEVNGMTVD